MVQNFFRRLWETCMKIFFLQLLYVTYKLYLWSVVRHCKYDLNLFFLSKHNSKKGSQFWIYVFVFFWRGNLNLNSYKLDIILKIIRIMIGKYFYVQDMFCPYLNSSVVSTRWAHLRLQWDFVDKSQNLLIDWLINYMGL